MNMNQPESYLQSLDPVGRHRVLCCFLHDQELLWAVALGAQWVHLRLDLGYGLLTLSQVRSLHAHGVMADVYAPVVECWWSPGDWDDDDGRWPRTASVRMDYPALIAVSAEGFLPGIGVLDKLAQDERWHTLRMRVDSYARVVDLAGVLGVVEIRPCQ